MQQIVALLILACAWAACAFHIPTHRAVARLAAIGGDDLDAGEKRNSVNAVPSSPRINVKRGILQGGIALVGGFLLSEFVPRAMSAVSGGQYPVKGDEQIMSAKSHGTSEAPVQRDLRWGCDVKLADRICNYNRRWAENAGYWQSTELYKELTSTNPPSGPISFYDSVTGKELFRAPVGRSLQDFVRESNYHGWPSFRDNEVVWDNVRCLGDGETVSLTGTHLGHNLPDISGNRYCINLVSVAGKPSPSATA